MSLEPREILHVEPPRLSLQLLSREIPSSDGNFGQTPNRVPVSGKHLLLIRPGVVIEDVEQRLDVQLREHSRRTEDQQRCLRIIRRRGVRIPWHVVLGLVRILRLRCTRVATLK